MLTESRTCEEGTVRQPSLKHDKSPMGEGSYLQPGEGKGKEPTRTERPPSAPRQQGVIATQSEEDRATATLCLSLDAIRAGVETTSHVADRALAVRGGDGTSTQPQAQQTSNVGRVKQTSR